MITWSDTFTRSYRLLAWSSYRRNDDCFYNWKLNPKYNKIKGELFYKITQEQMAWVKKNIISGVLADKYYLLIEN